MKYVEIKKKIRIEYYAYKRINFRLGGAWEVFSAMSCVISLKRTNLRRKYKYICHILQVSIILLFSMILLVLLKELLCLLINRNGRKLPYQINRSKFESINAKKQVASITVKEIFSQDVSKRTLPRDMCIIIRLYIHTHTPLYI